MPDFSVFHGKRVVVTGHTGFKGSWLSLWLNELGAEVFGISVDVPTHPSHFESLDLGSFVRDYRLDIVDAQSLRSLLEELKPDFVFHLAAQALVRQSYENPVETWRTNTVGTLNVLDALRECSHHCVAVLITSDKSYDNVEWVWGYRENDAVGGIDPYSASKGAAELAIRSYVRSYFSADSDVRIGVARAGNVIGGGDWAVDRIVPDCVKAWAKGETVLLRNPPATRPWQHVLEPLGGYLTLATNLNIRHELHGEAFNFGPLAQQNHSVLDLVTQMSRYWEQVRWNDDSAGYCGPHESGLLKLNCDKALHLLNWHATWGFEETVRATTLWYRNFYAHDQKNIREFSCRQIEAYTRSAREIGLEWA
jgi:CDP-glucose 4,6-dehydratase